ncbi:hypothetical protein SPRG_09527 [Saprolegnia parasitica CBS 223.65]|uniref:Uncharacterized protein n=1 Tax=Saprolegnia parasitica (strain CBS 223.65) TaxID=695850 RepID=A0A067C2Y7_SAPPC|nr:hypothetical protein SPRG_09527 [Saprolegnia parasitica CBS 223.65]KDO24883.1 hypothetical protein SPRG_09527 [Saprolegnia parasitica CBS 223.65]|eukprot:XP_012204343.1 hypothetical protein SPRG_09527 [Saprolegnia parasitica CBS 223.65]
MPMHAQKKRVLTKVQLETNRVRSKKYYEDNRDSVLAKLRLHYIENREKERQRQREKYLRIKARKRAAKEATKTLPSLPTLPCNPLSIAFLLN